MNLKPRRLSAVFLCLLTALSLLLCSCGRTASPGPAGKQANSIQPMAPIKKAA